jgi:hypothetical protein
MAIDWPSGTDMVLETLSRTDNGGATLVVYKTGGVDTGPPQWSVTIENIGTGRACTQPGDQVLGGGSFMIRVAPQKVSTEVKFGQKLTTVTGSGTPYLRICWSKRAPVQLSGAYLSARFPPVAGPTRVTPGTPIGDSISVSRVLNARVDDTALFNVQQSLTQPTRSTVHTWAWDAPYVIGATPVPIAQESYHDISAQQPIVLSAINVNGTQEDSDNALLSGIFLGVAGAALIALIQEIITLVRNRHADGASS